jgi:hypothetical protein
MIEKDPMSPVINVPYRYEVVWEKKGGRFTRKMKFVHRENAIEYLNVLILDDGFADAALRKIRQK